MTGVSQLVRELIGKKDLYAGGLMVVLGLGMALKGPGYGIGTLFRMGPGFMPTVLGVLLAFVGILISLGALSPEPQHDEDRFMPANPPWRGWFCILAGPTLFIVLGTYAGMIPATFACVFVSALGDRTSTVKSSFGAAVAVTIVGVIVFGYLLRVPMPLFGPI